jgi:alpha-methylacyl-CoA racemase
MGPLTGIRVIEFAGIGPAPFAGMLVADLGADVVRIDRPGGPPLSAFVDPARDPLGRGKRSIVVDLKHPDAIGVVRRLVGGADVLLEGFRPGVMERLGLGPEVCLAWNPRLVYGRMTGWGQDGPLARRAGHDLAYIAVTGALHAIGPAGGPPAIPVNLVGDFGGGALFLVAGVLAALVERARSGRGQVVDAAIVDGTAVLLAQLFGFLAAGVWRDRRGENFIDGGAPWYSVYRTRDGRYLAIAAIEPPFYAELLRRLGLAEEADLPGQFEIERWGELRSRIARVVETRTRDEWVAIFEGSDACAAPVLALGEAPAHPHLAARGTFERIHGVVQPAPAPRFSRTPAAVAGPPCAPGAHTDAVLQEAGFGADDVGQLRAAGCVA